MEYGDLKTMITQCVIFLVIGLITYILTKILKLNHEESILSKLKSKQIALNSILVVCFTITITCILAYVFTKVILVRSIDNTYNVFSFIFILICHLLIISPILVKRRIDKDAWYSLGITRANLLKSIFIGLILWIIMILLFVVANGMSILQVFENLKLNKNHLYALLFYAVIGFSEEFIYRGYLQTRLSNWIGKYRGWLFASIFMALAHLPSNILIDGMNLQEALGSAISLIPLSLLMGYIMIKTENITTSSIVHALLDWSRLIV